MAERRPVALTAEASGVTDLGPSVPPIDASRTRHHTGVGASGLHSGPSAWDDGDGCASCRQSWRVRAARGALCVALMGATLTWMYAAYTGAVRGYARQAKDADAILAATGMKPRHRDREGAHGDGCKPRTLLVCEGGVCTHVEYPCGVPPPPVPAPPRPAVKQPTRAQMLAEQLAEHRWQHDGATWDQRDPHTGEHEHKFFHKPPPPALPPVQSPPPPPIPTAPTYGHRGYSSGPEKGPEVGSRAALRLEMARRFARMHNFKYNTVYGEGELGKEALNDIHGGSGSDGGDGVVGVGVDVEGGDFAAEDVEVVETKKAQGEAEVLKAMETAARQGALGGGRRDVRRGKSGRRGKKKGLRGALPLEPNSPPASLPPSPPAPPSPSPPPPSPPPTTAFFEGRRMTRLPTFVTHVKELQQQAGWETVVRPDSLDTGLNRLEFGGLE